MVNPIPELSAFCIDLSTGPGMLCVRFPGGSTVCAQVGFDSGDPGAILRSLFAELNSALSPLAPFFIVLDVIAAMVNCIKAIPDCLGPPPNPEKLIKCLPDLLKKLAALLELLPQLSIPVLVHDLIDVVIVGLMALRNELAAMITQAQRIAAAATRAADTGNIQLNLAVNCANGNLSALFANKQIGMQPLNRLIGIINFLLGLAQLPTIPSLDDIETLDDTVLVGLDKTIQILEAAKAAIPIPD